MARLLTDFLPLFREWNDGTYEIKDVTESQARQWLDGGCTCRVSHPAVRSALEQRLGVRTGQELPTGLFQLHYWEEVLVVSLGDGTACGAVLRFSLVRKAG